MVSFVHSPVLHPSSPSRSPSSRSLLGTNLSSTPSVHLPSDYSFVLSPLHALPLDDYCLFWEHVTANDSGRRQFVQALLHTLLSHTHAVSEPQGRAWQRVRALEATLSLVAFHDNFGRRTVMVEYNKMAKKGEELVSGEPPWTLVALGHASNRMALFSAVGAALGCGGSSAAVKYQLVTFFGNADLTTWDEAIQLLHRWAPRSDDVGDDDACAHYVIRLMDVVSFVQVPSTAQTIEIIEALTERCAVLSDAEIPGRFLELLLMDQYLPMCSTMFRARPFLRSETLLHSRWHPAAQVLMNGEVTPIACFANKVLCPHLFAPLCDLVIEGDGGVIATSQITVASLSFKANVLFNIWALMFQDVGSMPSRDKYLEMVHSPEVAEDIVNTYGAILDIYTNAARSFLPSVTPSSSTATRTYLPAVRRLLTNLFGTPDARSSVSAPLQPLPCAFPLPYILFDAQRATLWNPTPTAHRTATQWAVYEREIHELLRQHAAVRPGIPLIVAVIGGDSVMHEMLLCVHRFLLHGGVEVPMRVHVAEQLRVCFLPGSKADMRGVLWSRMAAACALYREMSVPDDTLPTPIDRVDADPAARYKKISMYHRLKRLAPLASHKKWCDFYFRDCLQFSMPLPIYWCTLHSCHNGVNGTEPLVIPCALRLSVGFEVKAAKREVASGRFHSDNIPFMKPKLIQRRELFMQVLQFKALNFSNQWEPRGMMAGLSCMPTDAGLAIDVVRQKVTQPRQKCQGIEIRAANAASPGFHAIIDSRLIGPVSFIEVNRAYLPNGAPWDVQMQLCGGQESQETKL
eukprot:GEMP01012924.1.p1 GENE.GEMP01012924.1~~GEMP01012924.1.p1  ORF type:complete len:800 (+),score=194.59 GEMP01012924.1:288-2687(+)